MFFQTEKMRQFDVIVVGTGEEKAAEETCPVDVAGKVSPKSLSGFRNGTSPAIL